jgi:hypothetical protein
MTQGAAETGVRSEKPKTLLEVLETLDPIEEEFPPIEDLPPEPVEFRNQRARPGDNTRSDESSGRNV